MRKLFGLAILGVLPVTVGALGVSDVDLTSASTPLPAPDASLAIDVASSKLHLALKESSPKEDEMLSASPDAVTLWFTQAPQMSGTSVRLLPKGGEPMELGDARAMEDDPTVVVLGIGHTLGNGEYEVHWRAMAQDGHVIRGDFAFMVHAER